LFFFVTLWNDEACDNGNVMKQYNFQQLWCHCIEEGL